MPRPGRRTQAAGGATRTRLRTRVRDRSRAAGSRAHAIAVKLSSRAAQDREERAGRGGPKLLEATRQVTAQARQRLGRDAGRGDPAGKPARAGRPADRQGAASAGPSSSGTRPRSPTTTTVVLDDAVEQGNPAYGPQLGQATHRAPLVIPAALPGSDSNDTAVFAIDIVAALPPSAA